MNPISANVSALRNVMTLNSRAPRSEYWWVLATFIGGVVLANVLNAVLFPYGGQGQYSTLG